MLDVPETVAEQPSTVTAKVEIAQSNSTNASGTAYWFGASAKLSFAFVVETVTGVLLDKQLPNPPAEVESDIWKAAVANKGFLSCYIARATGWLKKKRVFKGVDRLKTLESPPLQE